MNIRILGSVPRTSSVDHAYARVSQALDTVVEATSTARSTAIASLARLLVGIRSSEVTWE
jgi:hypothetical protein